MLLPSEDEFVTTNVRDFYHLVAYNTHLFGEPFLRNDYLYYFDGQVVTLILPRIKGEITVLNLNETIDQIIVKHAPQNLIIWGETPTTEINPQPGYKLAKTDLDLWSREIIFNTANFVPSQKYQRYLRQSKAEDLHLNFVKSSYYKADYTKLLAQTHPNLLDSKSLSYYSLYPHLKETKFVEVLKDNQLISVNIILEVLPNYVCFSELGYDKNYDRASGLSKVLLFDYYLDKTKYISWGGCATEGIFQYKKEILGSTPLGFYNHYLWYEFYKTTESDWWLLRMEK